MAIKAIIASEFNPKGIRDAQAEFRKFRKSVADAQGFTGKFTAALNGATTAFTNFSASPAGIATLLGTVGTAALTAANEFAALSKSAIDLANATGLSTEEASRWIAVGDDFQVSAEALTASIGRIGKTLDGGTWERYGIATRDAAGNARNANDILLDAIDLLGRTTNETERAKIGNQLFGRGYSQLAPLIGKTRREYQQMLNTVEEGQVITAEEAARAEEWRLAQDKLTDAFNEFKYAAGQSVVELAPLVSLVAELLLISRELGEVPILGDFISSAERAINPIAGLTDAVSTLQDLLGSDESTNTATRAMGGLLDNTTRTYRIYEEYQRARENATTAEDDALPSVKNLVDAYRKQAQYLQDVIDRENELYGFERSLIEARQDFLAAQVEFNTVMGDAEATMQDQIDAAIGLSEEYATLEGASLDSRDGTMRQIEKLEELRRGVAPGSPLYNALSEYIRQLNLIPRNVTTRLGITGFTGESSSQLVAGVRADGGPVTANKPYLVGERGPELFVPSAAGMIVPNEQLVSGGVTGGSMGAGSVVLNVTVTNPVASGEQLANELAAYTRRNGTRWLAGVV